MGGHPGYGVAGSTGTGWRRGVSGRRRWQSCAWTATAVTITGLGLLSLTGTRAEPEVRESIETYDVHGSTAAQVRRELRRHGPRVGGRGYGGLTTWELTWTYTFEERGAECRLASYDVRVDVTSTLPRWIPDDPAPEDKLVAKWERYLSALEAHEEGHRRFGLEAASAVERSLSSIAPEPTCERVEAALAAAAQEVVEQYRERERRYDEETKHGRADGARF